MLNVLTDILNQLGYSEHDPNVPLRDCVSSLDIVELICIIEEKYNVSIPEEDTHVFGENLMVISEYLEGTGVKNEATEIQVV